MTTNSGPSASGNDQSDVDRSGAVCYKDRCDGDPTHRVQWHRGERWYGICESCADSIPGHRGTVLEGLTPETITTHPVATDGGTQERVSCQMVGCERPASGRYTRRMFAASEGEEWPDDVSDRPVCWLHYWIEEGLKAGIAGALFGAAFGVVRLSGGLL